MADGSSNLEIVISAVDEASAAFGEITQSLDGVAESATQMVDSTTASFNEFMASVTEAAAVTGQSEEDILRQMAATGQTAQEVATEIVAANDEVNASNDVTKGSFTSVGIAAGLVFYSLSNAVGSAISSAQQWNEESANIAQELKSTGSSIPLSQVQSYAQYVQSVTVLTQQQALQSEGLILSNKNLQGSYQELTLLSADLATKMSQVSGSMTDNLPNATKILTNALADPVAGMTQLIKQGTVDLPAATVTMIENMAKVGNTAGADAEIIKALGQQVGGMAQQAAQAPGAGLTQLTNQLTALGTTIANSGLLTTLNTIALDLIPIIQEVGQWAQEHPKLTEAIIIGAVAFAGFLAVLSLVGIAVAAVGSVVAAAAVGIAAVAAVIATTVIENWTLIQTDTEKIWNFITGIITTNWNDQKVLFHDALSDIQSLWHAVWQDMSDFLGTIWQTIESTVKTGVNDVIGAVNGFINALDALHISIPSISIPGTKLSTPSLNLGFNIPDIPMLAEGGFVTQPTLALIGESGPEAVVPLSSGYGGAGGQQIVINIQGGNYLDSQGASMIAQQLAKNVLRGLKVVNFAL